jgi:hypothetical protein
MSNKKYLNVHTTTTNETFTIHGCGKFSEEKKVLSKAEALYLYAKLHMWLMDK